MRISVLTVSDRCSRGEAEDKSGPLISELMSPYGETARYMTVPDERARIEEALIELCDDVRSDLVLTTGGTGRKRCGTRTASSMPGIPRRPAGCLWTGMPWAAMKKGNPA